MKKLVYLVILMAATVCGAEPQVVNPKVSQVFADLLSPYRDKYMAGNSSYNHILLTEGQWSSRYSNETKHEDYFVVPASNNGHGARLLRMVIRADEKNGVLKGYPVFSDEMSGLAVVPTLTKTNVSRVYLPEDHLEECLAGTLIIGTDSCHILVSYHNTGNGFFYPSVSLKWGEGSSITSVGKTQDDYRQLQIGEITSPKTAVTITSAYGKSRINGVPEGIYVGVVSPTDNTGVEASTDLKTWFPFSPRFQGVNEGVGYYQTTTNAPTSRSMFFRAKGI